MTDLRGKVRHMTRRPELARWMRANFAWFHAEVLEAGRPDWGLIAQSLALKGVTMAGGNPPTANATRLAYRRERDSRAANPTSPQPQAQPTQTEPSPSTDNLTKSRHHFDNLLKGKYR